MSADERKLHLWGWILFLMCACFFITSAVEGDNTLSLAGSIIFLAACVVFIIPLAIRGNQDEDN